MPGIFALIIGAAMFKRRVGGTYFAIITQAVAAILTILIVGQQGYTGGINGMTDLRTLKGWDIRPDHAKIVLYFFEVGCLFVCIFIAQFIRHSKLGRILVAMRDKEDRVRFSGYSVANFKIFAFCIAAVFAAIGGAMFALNVGFMSPSFVGIVPSIEMVIYTAVGGRLSILGAIYGTLLVNFAKTSLSESFPELWLFGLGGLFIAVVLAFPNGLAGIWGDYVQPRIDRLIASRKPKSGGWTDSSRRRRRPGRVRRSIMLIGHQPKDFLLAVEGAHGFLRRLQGGQRSVLLCRGERDPRHHRPERRRQDHGARPDLRQDQGDLRFDPVSRQGADEDEGKPDRAGRRRPQIPDAVDLRRPHGVRESRNLVSARPHRVRRADLHPRRRGARPRPRSRRDDLPEGPAAT